MYNTLCSVLFLAWMGALGLIMYSCGKYMINHLCSPKELRGKMGFLAILSAVALYLHGVAFIFLYQWTSASYFPGTQLIGIYVGVTGAYIIRNILFRRWTKGYFEEEVPA